MLKKEERDLEKKAKENSKQISNLKNKNEDEDDDLPPFMHRLHTPKRHGSLADLLEGMDDGPNEMPRPHISIRPIGGPFGGPFGGPMGFPFGGLGRPTGPVHVEHVSLADFFKNIAKPGPHPSFLDDKKENDDKKPATDVKTTPAIKITDITAPAVPAVAETKKPETAVPAPKLAEPLVISASAAEAPIKPIKLINPIKAAAEIKK